MELKERKKKLEKQYGLILNEWKSGKYLGKI
jgi:hypothetical protein